MFDYQSLTYDIPYNQDTTFQVYQELTERGVALEDVAYWAMVFELTRTPDVPFSDCLRAVKHALERPLLQQAVLMGIEMDKLLERPNRETVALLPDFILHQWLPHAVSHEYGETVRAVCRMWDTERTEVIQSLSETQNNTFLRPLMALIVGVACDSMKKNIE